VLKKNEWELVEFEAFDIKFKKDNEVYQVTGCISDDDPGLLQFSTNGKDFHILYEELLNSDLDDYTSIVIYVERISYFINTAHYFNVSGMDVLNQIQECRNLVDGDEALSNQLYVLLDMFEKYQLRHSKKIDEIRSVLSSLEI
jgi:hypothetical protein